MQLMKLTCAELKQIKHIVRNFLSQNPGARSEFNGAGHFENQMSSAEIEAAFSKSKVATLKLNANSYGLTTEALKLCPDLLMKLDEFVDLKR